MISEAAGACRRNRLTYPSKSTTPDPTAERLAEIRDRADAASPGPWHYDPEEAFRFGGCDHVFVESPMAGRTGMVALTGCGEPAHEQPRTRPNAAFIAHSRDDVAFLLGEVDRLAGELARLEHTGGDRRG